MKKIILFIILPGMMLAESNSQFKGTFMRSAILPGWGEARLGLEDRSHSFFRREGLLWLAFLGEKSLSSWYEDDYKAFGTLHASVDMSDKSYQFAVDMGNYDSFEAYNFAKDQYRQIDEKYPEGEGYEWNWNSTENREIFEDLRIKSATADKYASFVVGGLFLHRIVSVIDILYMKRSTSRIQLESSLIPRGKKEVNFLLSIRF